MVKIPNKVKDLVSIGGTDIIVTGISGIFWFYLASFLGPQDYGEITYFIAIANLASTISLFGATKTLMIYPAKNINIQSGMYVLTLIAGLISSIIVFVLFYNIGTSFLVIGLIIYGLITSELIGRKLFKEYSKYMIIQRVLLVVISLGLYYFLGKEWIIPGIVISYTPFIFEIIRGFRKYKIDFYLIKEKLGFIKYSYVESLSGAISGSLDKLIIAPIFGFAMLGNYSLGIQFLTLLTIIPLAVVKYLIPSESAGNKNKKIYNSSDNGFTYHVKVFEIDYKIFEKEIEMSN